MPTVDAILASNQTIRLHDGRVLGYAEYGRPDGKALFYFHGHPGARLEARFLADQAAQTGIRLIGVDRPGMGQSSFQSGRRLLDWPNDVVELANTLQIDQFAVVGFSGGGPYALACAYRIPHRLTACATVAGVGHINPLLAFLSQWVPWLLLPITRRFFSSEEQAQSALIRAADNWVEPDKKSILLPGIKELMAASLVEALRPGTRGAAYDGALLGRPWGFRLEAVSFPMITLWHGELDKEVPVSIGKEVAGKLRQCNATYYPDEGHISIIVNHARDIVSVLS